MKVLFVYPNDYKNYGIPTGLATLIANTKRAGHEVGLFDFTFIKNQHITHMPNPQIFLPVSVTMDDLVKDDPVQSVEDVFREKLKSFKPDLIAMSCMTGTFDMGIKLLKKFKNQLECPVIVGGIHSTIDPTDALSNDVVDFICRGEGEEMLLELCDALENNKDWKNIKNLGFKKNGNVLLNPIRPLVDINTLPCPDWDIFDRRHLYRAYMGKVYSGSFYVMSRGCPMKCTYCVDAPLERMFKETGSAYFRYQSPQTTIKQLTYLKEKFGATWYKFADDSIMLFPVKYLEELSEGVAPLGIQFGCSVRVETTSDHKVKLLKKMGCVAMSVGLESGSAEIRKAILNRKMTDERIERAINIIKDNDIRVSTFNMLGIPNETREQVFETINFNRKLGVDSVNVYVLYPYPGTDIYTDAKISYRYPNGDMIPVGKASEFHLSQMEPSEVDGLCKTFNLYLELDKLVWPLIELAESEEHNGSKIYKLLGNYSAQVQLRKLGRLNPEEADKVEDLLRPIAELIIGHPKEEQASAALRNIENARLVGRSFDKAKHIVTSHERRTSYP